MYMFNSNQADASQFNLQLELINTFTGTEVITLHSSVNLVWKWRPWVKV